MRNRLGILFLCLFAVMIGYGLTLPVLAFYIERLALTEGATIQKASLHVGLLTGIFALMQFFFAPVWGRWSDRVGRRPRNRGAFIYMECSCTVSADSVTDDRNRNNSGNKKV